MKKIVLALLATFAVLFSSCTFMSGIDEAPELKVFTDGYDVAFTWNVDYSIDHYVMHITGVPDKGKNESWEPFVMDHKTSMEGTYFVPGVGVTNSKLHSNTMYTFELTPVSTKNIKGPKSAAVKMYYPTFDPYYTNLYLEKTATASQGVTVKWDNLVFHRSSYGKNEKEFEYGSKTVYYKVRRTEGTEQSGNYSWSAKFVADDGDSTKIIADKIKPKNELEKETLVYVDTDVVAGKCYKYEIIPCNDYNWESSRTIQPEDTKTYYTKVN